MLGVYFIGNSCQVNWVRSIIIIGNIEVWGGGKCMIVDFLDVMLEVDRCFLFIYMLNGDFYLEINRVNGGYVYKIINCDLEDENQVLEMFLLILINFKKFIVGLVEDNEGKVIIG